ncbi:MAG: AsmA-like C-terminal domain-containing protein [Nitrospirae bacterium]|nr:AsmA-like C-terminal domain-containing protein [Candidatus Manganitrophaceae bacterium]
MKSGLGREKKSPLWVAVFLLALSSVLFVLPSWITLNRWIPSLTERFQNTTGRPLSIDQLRISFLTGPELRFIGVAVGSAGGAGGFAQAEEIQIGFQLLPLIRRQFIIKEVRLVRPVVDLVRDQDGTWNFDDFLSKKKSEKERGWTVQLRSGFFLIQKGTVFLTDRIPPKKSAHLSNQSIQWTAEGVDAKVEHPPLNGRVLVRVESPAVWRSDLPEKPTGVKVEGTIEGGGFFRIRRPLAHLAVSLVSFDSSLIKPYLPESVPSFFTEESHFKIDGESADLPSLERLLRSDLFQLEGASNGLSVILDEAISPLQVEQAAWRYNHQKGTFAFQNSRLNHSTLPTTSGQLLSLFSDPRIDIDTAGRVAVPDLSEVLAERFQRIWLKETKAQGFIDATLAISIPLHNLSAVDFKGQFRLQEGTFTPFRAFEPIRKIKATGRVEGRLLVIESAEGAWGDAQLKATGRMPDLRRQGIEFDLRATTLDWDAIRSTLPEDQGSSSKAIPKKGVPKEEKGAPTPSEGKGYAVGLIQIDRLKIKGFDFFKCKSALTYRGGVLEFQETEAVFEEGRFRANFAQIYYRPDGGYALALIPDLREINVGAFFKDWERSDARPVMSGRALIAGGLNTEGRTFQDFKSNLKGKLVVYLEKGTIYRFKTLANIFSLMNLRSLPELNAKGIVYDAFSGTLGINQGKVTLYNTVLYGRDVRVISDGEIDLGKDRLDLLMGVQVFRLVDDILRKIPLLGPILLGQDKMFIASYFEVKGKITEPRVEFKPFKTLKESTLSVLRRAITFPARPEIFSG